MELAAQVLYPILPLSDDRHRRVHDLVMQVFTGGFVLFTAIWALEHRRKGSAVSTFVLVTKFVLCAVALLAAVATSASLLQPHMSQRGISLVSYTIAVLAVFVAFVLLASREEEGVLFWLEAVICVTNLFWIWRTAQAVLPLP